LLLDRALDTPPDGAEQPSTCLGLRPDVIVLDVNLPNVRSVEACREITRVNPEMKVIMFTVPDDPNTSQAFFEAGASAFVTKLASGDLLAIIKRLCAD
jgi:DNA-binding NarL/FixJ family response regulator